MSKKKIEGIDDGGARMEYGTGAIREPNIGKGRFDLLSPHALMRLAKWYELGAAKYADRNWEKGIPVSRCVDSAFRHMVKYMRGDNDECHLSAILWNISAIIHFEDSNMTDVLDLPRHKKGD